MKKKHKKLKVYVLLEYAQQWDPKEGGGTDARIHGVFTESDAAHVRAERLGLSEIHQYGVLELSIQGNTAEAVATWLLETGHITLVETNE